MPVYFTDGRKGVAFIPKEYDGASYLMHYRVGGEKKGIRRWQDKSGKFTPEGYKHYAEMYGWGKGKDKKQESGDRSYSNTDNVFISGKVKYDKPLTKTLRKEIDSIIKSNAKILIGDAPGADTRVQEYLSKKGYKNVEVYTTDNEVRNNVGGWKVNKIDASKFEDEREARAQKDIAMTKQANKGLAISSADDRPDSATSKNIQRMLDQGSNMVFYDYKTDGMEVRSSGHSSDQEKKVRGPSPESSKQRMQGEWGGADDPEYSRKVLEKVNIPVENLNSIKHLDQNDDIAQVRRDINHRNQEPAELSNTGREYNCPNCACAFEMVERGYDVVARRAVDGSNVGDIEKRFKGGHLEQASYSDWEDNNLRFNPPTRSGREYKKWQKKMQAWSEELSKARKEAIDKLQETLEHQGTGARGIIVVGWLPDDYEGPTTSFHALNYKVESDGHMTLYDAQSYRKCNGAPDLGMLYGCDPRELHFMRTDNLELDDSITRMVYSRGRGDK